MAEPLTDLSISELSGLIRTKHLSPVELTEATLARIEALQPKLNAFLTVTGDAARSAAREADREIGEGHYRGPLHGIPWAVKDIAATKGVPTSSGAYFERDHIPAEDAAVVSRLNEAGAIVVGKTNTVPFAYGSVEHDPTFGDVHNPWDLKRITAGSSTGSAASLAARVVPLALGTDTGGSIRMPAAMCGITGLKPTFGLVSRFGITAISSSFDHAGPMARTALDCATALNAMAGYDPRDASSVRRAETDYTQGIDDDIKGVRIGVPWDYIRYLWTEDVEAAFMAALKILEGLGAKLVDVAFPELEFTGPMFPMITGAEVVEVHRERLKAHAAEYNPGIRRRVEAGFFVPAAAYVHAQRLRRSLGRKFGEVFNDVDLFATPSNLAPAFPIGDEMLMVRGKEVHHVDVVLRMMRIYNVNGLPAISIPGGFSGDNLPIGFQLAGKWFDDALVLRAAHAFQKATDWHLRKPDL